MWQGGNSCLVHVIECGHEIVLNNTMYRIVRKFGSVFNLANLKLPI